MNIVMLFMSESERYAGEERETGVVRRGEEAEAPKNGYGDASRIRH